jgi:hypothetical protein
MTIDKIIYAVPAIDHKNVAITTVLIQMLPKQVMYCIAAGEVVQCHSLLLGYFSSLWIIL